MKSTFLLCFLFCVQTAVAQTSASLTGNITDVQTAKAIAGATVTVEGAGAAALSDSLGRYTINGAKPGSYTITASAVGYARQSKFNIVINSGNVAELSFELQPEARELQGVVIETGRRAVARVATIETPLSVQRLTVEEIKSNPGGNFDISKVVQSLPGVGSGAGGGGFRNDIIIRGGAPNENVYYLDGIEIPTLNHFATQGAGGGPQGILNVSFIEDVKLSSSAFDARYDNALSSVFEFKQKTGNTERLQGNIRLSGTELAATFDGPASSNGKVTFLASARRSYLQLLFSLLDLPIRPNFWDFQNKVTWKINEKNTLNFIGVAAIDEFSFSAVNELDPDKVYTLNRQPVINQWAYTTGVSWRRSLNNGVLNLALSRNALNNNLEKYDNNDNSLPQNLRLLTTSRETENKLRLDVSRFFNGFKLAYGATVQYAQYTNDSYIRLRAQVQDGQGNVVQPAVVNAFNSGLSFWKGGAFVQLSKRFLDNRLGLSAGLRTDVNSFTTGGGNPVAALSPRVSASYALTDRWNLNASVGRYAKLPPYTILGFQSNDGRFANRSADYLIANHYVGGLEFLPRATTRFTVEGFYKAYSNVPVSVRDGISLSNLGTDFGAIGNEAVVTNGRGQAYGVEFFAQQKFTRRFFGVLSYTWFHSRYSGADDVLRRSAWDNRHLLSFTGGYKWGRGWELGLKYRVQGGSPYTPFNDVASRTNFLSLGEGVLDFSRLNTRQLGTFSSSDIRIDKKWNFRRFTLDLYLDVTNWLAAPTRELPRYSFRRNEDNTAFLTTDGQAVRPDGSNAIPFLLQEEKPQVLPTIGFILEF